MRALVGAAVLALVAGCGAPLQNDPAQDDRSPSPPADDPSDAPTRTDDAPAEVVPETSTSTPEAPADEASNPAEDPVAPDTPAPTERIGGDLAHLRRHTIQLGFNVSAGDPSVVAQFLGSHARVLLSCHDAPEDQLETAAVVLRVSADEASPTVDVGTSNNLDEDELECLTTAVAAWDHTPLLGASYELNVDYVWVD